jgi:hypothetical protein
MQGRNPGSRYGSPLSEEALTIESSSPLCGRGLSASFCGRVARAQKAPAELTSAGRVRQGWSVQGCLPEQSQQTMSGPWCAWGGPAGLYRRRSKTAPRGPAAPVPRLPLPFRHHQAAPGCDLLLEQKTRCPTPGASWEQPGLLAAQLVEMAAAGRRQPLAQLWRGAAPYAASAAGQLGELVQPGVRCEPTCCTLCGKPPYQVVADRRVAAKE